MATPNCTSTSNVSYLKIAGTVGNQQTCNAGELRLGIFFDGTGNDIKDPVTYSNVKKLCDVYPNQINESEQTANQDHNYPNIQALYVRGVGTRFDSLSSNGVTGGAFGAGGMARISGMVHLIQVAMKNFKKEYKFYPEKIVMDVFGFSRGAALARHFVNVIKQNFFKLDAAYNVVKPNNYEIRTLNIFDTVGSFGLPGNNTDLGYTFNIQPNWVTRGITHFAADDEYRKNFDLQTISSAQQLEYPVDIPNASELIFPGAHSDVGGGYGLTDHQRTNHDLAKIPLHSMYDTIKSKGVPLRIKPKSDSWNIPDKLKIIYDSIQMYYSKYPKLKIAHKKFRERQARVSDMHKKIRVAEEYKLIRQLEKDNKEKYNAYFKSRQGWRILLRHDRSRLQDLGSQAHMIRTMKKNMSFLDDVRSCFNSDDECDKFLHLAADLHNNYIHISSSLAIGMGAQVSKNKSKDSYIRHRTILYSKKIDLQWELQETRRKARIVINNPSLLNSLLAIGTAAAAYEVIYPKKFT